MLAHFLEGCNQTTYLCRPFQQRLMTRGTLNGGIAQLARALAWHARGPGFESPYLHQQPATGSGFWLRSTMDSAWVSGTQNLGSIPSGATFSLNPGSLRARVFLRSARTLLEPSPASIVDVVLPGCGLVLLRHLHVLATEDRRCNARAGVQESSRDRSSVAGCGVGVPA